MEIAPTPCPKCRARYTWIAWEGQCLVLRCTCGLNQYLYHHSREDGFTTLVPEPVGPPLRVPTPGTKRHRCVVAMVDEYPRTLTTTVIAESCSLRPKETSAIMVLLMTTGVATRVQRRKGFVGGSLWALSDDALDLMSVRQRYLRSI